VYVPSNVWPPVNPMTGAVASTGWHTHPGYSLIIVTSGTITEHEADCTPHVYAFVPGQPAPTLVDPGRDHEHIIRNEGSVAASTIAVQFVPYDPNRANRRIDAPARRTAPTFCKEEGQIGAAGIDLWTRIRPTRPWIAHTMLDRNDNDESFASSIVETWQ
jgi:hypothetical protein